MTNVELFNAEKITRELIEKLKANLSPDEFKNLASSMVVLWTKALMTL